MYYITTSPSAEAIDAEQSCNENIARLQEELKNIQETKRQLFRKHLDKVCDIKVGDIIWITKPSSWKRKEKKVKVLVTELTATDFTNYFIEGKQILKGGQVSEIAKTVYGEFTLATPDDYKGVHTGSY